MATLAESGVWLFTGKGAGVLNPGVLIPIYQAGGETGAFAVADVNGDGKLDLIASVHVGFALLLGNGDGTFQPEIDTVIPFLGTGLTVGDLNGDGRPDVVVVSNGSSFGLLYFGKGDGTFAPVKAVNLGPYPTAVAIADANGDGFADIISSTSYIVFGNGKGQFSSPIGYPISGNGDAGYVTTAHLRSKDLTDLIFQNNPISVSVLLSQGKGHYQDGEAIPVAGGGAGCAVTSDFNRDGITDLAVVVGQGISILLGTGKAALAYTQGEVLTVPTPGCLVEGDLNGDGIPDLLIPSGSPNGAAIAFLGKGDGTFTQVAQSTPMSTTSNIALGDFNGDGKLDWASASNLLAVGNGDGTFQLPAPYIPRVVSTSISGIAAARLNGDRETDIVLTDYFNYRVYILPSNGKQGFTETTFNSNVAPYFCIYPFFPVLADVNGDGNKDLLLGCGDRDTPIFLNDGTGKFTYNTEVTYGLTDNASYPIVADVNGDGVADIVVLSDYDVGVFLGEGSMTFASPIYLGNRGSPGVVLAVNAHGQHPYAGKPDLVVTDASGVVDVIVNTTR